jgi:hypothetical protein
MALPRRVPLQIPAAAGNNSNLQLPDLAVQIIDHLLRIPTAPYCRGQTTRPRASPAPVSSC